jgi:hypothetical protein
MTAFTVSTNAARAAEAFELALTPIQPYVVSNGELSAVLASFLSFGPVAADLPRGAYWSPKNRRTRPDLRARTRNNGSENTTWEMLPYRS